MRTWAWLGLAGLGASIAAAADCPVACPLILAPVCASNGKTYNSKCEFEVDKCKSNDTSLTIVRDGACGSSDGSGGAGGAGTPECSKEFACVDVYDPVCGSDGITYSNDCILKKAQCTNKAITKVSNGECKPSSVTKTPSPSPSQTSNSAASSSGGGSGSAAACSKMCTKEIDFVCGSDGVTYTNQCLLEVEKECKSPSLVKTKDGECNSTQAPGTPATTAPASSSAKPVSSVGIVAASCWTIVACLSS